MTKLNQPKQPRKQLLAIFLVLGILPALLLALILVYLVSKPAQPTKPFEVLLNDDFNNYKNNTVLNDKSTWQVISGALETNTSKFKSKWVNIVGKVYHEPHFLSDYSDVEKLFIGSLITTGDSQWSNYAFKVRVEPLDNSGFGLVFRFQDPKNFYRLLITNKIKNKTNQIILEKNSNGSFSEIKASVNENQFDTLRAGSWYRLKLLANQNQFELFIDGNKIAAFQDSSLKTGKIGLWSWEQTGVFFDDVIVTKLD